MTIRKYLLFDFCIIHDCSVHFTSSEATSNSIVYLFQFSCGYKYRYTISRLDLVMVDHRVLESVMLNMVEEAYEKHKKKGK